MIVVDERRLSSQAPHVTCTDPRLPAVLDFRTPRSDGDPDLEPGLIDQMAKAVGLRGTMSAADLAELDSLTTWPLAMVARGDQLVGCLTPVIDRDYFVDTRPPGGQPALRLSTLTLLPIAADRLRELGIARPPVEDNLVRLALLARLAYAIEVVHRPRAGRRLVFGDLSLRTAAVAARPPRILLLDCDGIADEADPDRLQLNTSCTVPPELQREPNRLQDQLTDIYKLALCVLRGLATGRAATQITDPAGPAVRPGVLDPTGIDLLHHALSADRSRRPTAEEIKDYLIGRVLELAERPRARTT